MNQPACFHCRGITYHREGCITLLAERARAREVRPYQTGDRVEPLDDSEAQFAAIGVAVMRGAERYAVARSHNAAKRIARALNATPPNPKGY